MLVDSFSADNISNAIEKANKHIEFVFANRKNAKQRDCSCLHSPSPSCLRSFPHSAYSFLYCMCKPQLRYDMVTTLQSSLLLSTP